MRDPQLEEVACWEVGGGGGGSRWEVPGVPVPPVCGLGHHGRKRIRVGGCALLDIYSTDPWAILSQSWGVRCLSCPVTPDSLELQGPLLHSPSLNWHREI